MIITTLCILGCEEELWRQQDKPRHRGRGLGKKLIEERIKLAYAGGARYVQPELTDASARIYATIGFLPLLKISPRYDEGSPATIMGKVWI